MYERGFSRDHNLSPVLLQVPTSSASSDDESIPSSDDSGTDGIPGLLDPSDSDSDELPGLIAPGEEDKDDDMPGLLDTDDDLPELSGSDGSDIEYHDLLLYFFTISSELL